MTLQSLGPEKGNRGVFEIEMGGAKWSGRWWRSTYLADVGDGKFENQLGLAACVHGGGNTPVLWRAFRYSVNSYRLHKYALEFGLHEYSRTPDSRLTAKIPKRVFSDIEAHFWKEAHRLKMSSMVWIGQSPERSAPAQDLEKLPPYELFATRGLDGVTVARKVTFRHQELPHAVNIRMSVHTSTNGEDVGIAVDPDTSGCVLDKCLEENEASMLEFLVKHQKSLKTMFSSRFPVSGFGSGNNLAWVRLHPPGEVKWMRRMHLVDV